MNIRRLTALVAVALLVTACSTAGAVTDPTADGDGGELGATTWVLQSYLANGALTIVPDDLFVDADFLSNRVTGFSACNTYDAVYRSGGRLLLISQTVVTRLACAGPPGELEAAYLALLEQSRFYNVSGSTLTIRGSDLTVLLVFEAGPTNPLLGAWVVNAYATAPGTTTAPLAGTSLTAVFGLSKVGGSSGCNTYSGPYTTNGTVAAIGPLASTRMACADDVMAQETAFLAALQGVARVNFRGQVLELQDRNGGLVVALVRPYAIAPVASPSASAAPSASATPSAPPSPSASASASASPSPSPTPTASPTPTPSPSPTPLPPSAPPSAAASASLPPTASCVISAPGVVATATMVYPANWFTVTTPANLACRYFDPAPITVPADPSTLVTAIQVAINGTTSYADALASATNPTAWNVLVNEPATAGGVPASRIEATSTAGSPGFPPGVTRYGYLLNLGTRSAWIQTSGTVGAPPFTTNTPVVDLMAAQSSITPP